MSYYDLEAELKLPPLEPIKVLPPDVAKGRYEPSRDRTEYTIQIQLSREASLRERAAVDLDAFIQNARINGDILEIPSTTLEEVAERKNDIKIALREFSRRAVESAGKQSEDATERKTEAERLKNIAESIKFDE